MTPIEFGLSRSKVKVTVKFKLRGTYMFHKHFLFTMIQTIQRRNSIHFTATIYDVYIVIKCLMSVYMSSV